MSVTPGGGEGAAVAQLHWAAASRWASPLRSGGAVLSRATLGPAFEISRRDSEPFSPMTLR